LWRRWGRRQSRNKNLDFLLDREETYTRRVTELVQYSLGIMSPYISVSLFALLAVCFALLPYAQRLDDKWNSLPTEEKMSYWKDQYKSWCCAGNACTTRGTCYARIENIFIEYARIISKKFVGTECRVADTPSKEAICKRDVIDNLKLD
jgi:hypothetical protein